MTTDLRNFRCFIHKIQVIQTHLKVTYLHRWNFLTLFLFICTVFLGQI